MAKNTANVKELNSMS